MSDDSYKEELDLRESEIDKSNPARPVKESTMNLTKQGVRNLDNLKPRRPSPKVNRLEVSTRPSKLDDDMGADLIYDAQEAGAIRERFPEAVIEYDYDSLHGARLSVRAKCSLREWLSFVITSGLGPVSFACHLLIKLEPDLVSDVLDDVDPEWRE